ncbi:uncharacterized protein LOC133191462 isoform X2 [Saccostrea echinata]|uniref:uncharacterized protein LOC133191462 isoform X2 n=1 Tax=Saccostrea echinata TaxID=191078 RepID=UPI002A834876|nr:uncharacterized protein LOC133191462 isoform X2 [Saccostrea echinata]
MLKWTWNIYDESYKYLKIYAKCKKLLRKNVPIDTALSKPKDGGVPFKTPGIYTFKQKRKVIYLGMSSKDIRTRLQAHLSNNDYQEVGLYLQKWHFNAITVSWVKETNADIKEKQYLEIITNLQDNVPHLNKTSGNSKKATKKCSSWRILR